MKKSSSTKKDLRLRKSSEVTENSYNIPHVQEFIPDFQYIHILISIAEDYVETIKQKSEAYRQVIQLILHTQTPLLIYCVGGTDRSGILFVLLYWLCDLPKQKIIEDYYLSVTGKSHFSVEKFMDFLEKNGKEHVFNSILKLEEEDLEQLKLVLTKKQK
ncbi:MAG: tyrosine-protein phosphatase [Candidatus Lokiarchaeota archaeon]|nr:tyrosine-protein phosphatase [Candidatus Harpocratesius repetitus]